MQSLSHAFPLTVYTVVTNRALTPDLHKSIHTTTDYFFLWWNRIHSLKVKLNTTVFEKYLLTLFSPPKQSWDSSLSKSHDGFIVGHLLNEDRRTLRRVVLSRFETQLLTCISEAIHLDRLRWFSTTQINCLSLRIIENTKVVTVDVTQLSRNEIIL